MKIKLADYIADFLADNGINEVFTVTGGGAMHLNDAFGHSNRLHCTYNHHEQASAIAAEGYARLEGRVACVCVTSGPGGTNAITGVLGAWLDSIPVFVISGQVKRCTTVRSCNLPLRQLGDQEFDITNTVVNMTKYSVMVNDPMSIRYHLEKALYLCKNGRMGPVWLDIPLDVQASIIETDNLKGYEPEETKIPSPDFDTINTVFNKLKNSRRPVIVVGEGIHFGKCIKELHELAEKLKIPVLTAWNAHDIIPDDFPYYCGRPGTVGTRAGNFITEACDLMLVLGCRMNIRQISYNYDSFAKDAYKIQVDIDENELEKPTFKPDYKICCDVSDFIKEFNAYLKDDSYSSNKEWLNVCRNLNLRYPAVLPEYRNPEKLNPYVLIDGLFDLLVSGDNIICGNGSACVITFQAAKIKEGQRLFTNSGCAAMGYGFPAAIGCAVAEKGKKRTICIDGDGSFMMNIQELMTAVYNKLDLKILIINNNGYHSIRQTQRNIFNDGFVGVDKDSGIGFPDFEKLSASFGNAYYMLDREKNINEKVTAFLETEGVCILEAVVDCNQEFAPKLSSKVMPDGKIVSPPIDDMYPFLDRKEYEDIRKRLRAI